MPREWPSSCGMAASRETGLTQFRVDGTCNAAAMLMMVSCPHTRQTRPNSGCRRARGPLAAWATAIASGEALRCAGCVETQPLHRTARRRAGLRVVLTRPRTQLPRSPCSNRRQTQLTVHWSVPITWSACTATSSCVEPRRAASTVVADAPLSVQPTPLLPYCPAGRRIALPACRNSASMPRSR